MEIVTYYGVLAGGRAPDNPSGLIRRRMVDGQAPIDEVFNRELKWESTDFLFKYEWLGHNDIDYVEINKEQADTFVRRAFERRRG